MKLKLSQRLALSYYKTKIRAIGVISPKKAAFIAFTVFCTPRKNRKQLKAPPLFHKAEKVSLSLNETTIRGFRFIPINPNGKKIIVLHGFSSYSYKFEKYIQLFKSQGFEVFAFDAPAHGISDGKLINAILYKQAIIAIDKKFGPFFGLMGHSLGGLAAALAVKEVSDQENRRLVLIAPAVYTRTAIEHFYTLISADQKFKIAFETHISELTQESIDQISVPNAIKDIHMPILWIHDKADKICPFNDVIPLLDTLQSKVQFKITSGLGHSRIYKEAAVSSTIDHFFRESLN